MPTNTIDQQTFERAYQRARDLEGQRKDHHLDHKNVDTFGRGYTPVVMGREDRWVRRPNLKEDFAQAGVQLTSTQDKAFDTIVRERNAG
jgi:hypothetical protein